MAASPCDELTPIKGWIKEGVIMLNFEELISQRRSIRDFLDKPVPQDLIVQMIQDSCQAPSAANNQPWHFIVVQNTEMIRVLSDEAKKNIVCRIKERQGASLSAYLEDLEEPSFNIFHNAPCLIYIVGNPKISSLAFDASLAAAYFMLSATSRGLGTCWVGLGREIQDPTLLASIGVPAGFKIIVPLIVGYPRQIPPPPPRKSPVILKVIT
jgi:nitroreductase